MNTPVFLSRPGLVCCAGGTIDALYDAVRAGNRQGIVPVQTASGKQFLAGRMDDALLAPESPSCHTKLVRMTLASVTQLEDAIAHVLRRYGADRIAVCAGSCDNGSEASTAAHKLFFERGIFPAGYTLEQQGAAIPARFIAETFHTRGPCVGCAAACASSADALIQAASLIQSGLCDAAIAGGVDILSDTVLLGFDSLGVIAPELSNPFSKNRNGVNLGEAACFFVLSREPFTSVALLGSGQSSDAFHMTAPAEDGAGAADAMRDALRQANLQPDDIDYINLHGTGTQQNDRMEARAVYAVFAGQPPPSSSTKSITGHTLGAAGALEAALCWAAIQKRSPPPHCWDGVYDDALPRLTFAGAGGANIQTCMSNSFAFGGCNISLIIGECT